MREGYKNTECGAIPVDWEVVRQDQVAKFYNGRAYKLDEWETEGTPVIRLQNLTGSGKDFYYSNLELPKHQYCHRGDLLYMWSATFGPVWWWGDKAIYHYHIWRIEHDSKRLDKHFHYYMLDSVTTRMKTESHGSTMLHVTKGGMEKLLVQLPPLPEQQKIAEILSTVDDKIDIIDQQISETQDLKNGLMQRLLTKGIGHTEFKDSTLGEIPESWEVVKISELTNVVTKGTTPTTNGFSYLKEGINFIKVESIHTNGNFIPSMFAHVGNDCHNSFRRSQLKEYDILFTIAGALGRCAIVKKEILPANTNQAIAIIRLIKPEYRKYIFHYLRGNNIKILIERINVSTAQANLSLGQINQFDIPLPPFPELQQIADMLTTVDNKIDVLTEKKNHFQELKKGLMQQLLTGKIRVNGLIDNSPRHE